MKTEKQNQTIATVSEDTVLSAPDNGLYANIDALWEQASGPLAIPMTNDYLFRALLQENNNVLKGLIASLLHIPVQDISSVEITNPIELGKSYEDKDFYLDVKILLNNHTTINLEMQVINEHNWPERSLSYLCRIFDNRLLKRHACHSNRSFGFHPFPGISGILCYI